jgi:hypothetical protein
LKGPLLRTLARTGARRGLFRPKNRGWLALGILTGLIQFARRKRDEPKVSLTEKLEPGQSIVITHLGKDEAR